MEKARKVPQPAAQMPPKPILPQPAARVGDANLWLIPWFHHIVLMEKVKDRAARFWYMRETLANGWSRSVLLLMVKSEAHRRQGQALTNFDRLLPSPQSDLAQQLLKDPYIFDFLTIEEPFHERELETNLLHQLERFLLELGQGFAFVSRQYCVKVGEQEFPSARQLVRQDGWRHPDFAMPDLSSLTRRAHHLAGARKKFPNIRIVPRIPVGPGDEKSRRSGGRTPPVRRPDVNASDREAVGAASCREDGIATMDSRTAEQTDGCERLHRRVPFIR
jgi:predicted nuclease of restriction endonuclease-like (RecB) superfamily